MAPPRDNARRESGSKSGLHKEERGLFHLRGMWRRHLETRAKSGASGVLCTAVKSEREQATMGLIVVARDRSNLVLPIARRLERAAAPR